MKPNIKRAGLLLLILYDEHQVPIYLDKLKEYGYQNVISCTQGEEAIQKLASGEFSLVITDTELKGKMNGIDLGRKVRQEFNLPLIYLSRLQDETTLSLALETKPRAFLGKPVNWNELRVAVESAMFFNDEMASLNSVINEFTQRFEEAPLPYQILDADGRFTCVNKAWVNLMGYSANEVIGKWFGDYMIARFHPALKQCFDTAKKTGSINDLECDLIKKDGHGIHIAFEGNVQYGLRKEILSIRCVLNDITERQRIKGNLLESEKRFRLLFEEAPLGYQSLAGNGGIIYVNNAWCKMLGYSKKEAIGKWFGDFLAPEERKRFIENFSVFRQKGEVYNIKYKMIRKDGEAIYIIIDGIIRYDEGGNYIQSHCILKDITSQRFAEDALLQSEKKFRNLIESAGDIIYVLDHDLKYVYGNKQYLKRHGLTLEEMIGKDYGDFHSDERKSEFKKEVMTVYEAGNPVFYEYQSKTDGKYFLRTISPVMDFETNKFESITVFSRDITDRKKAEEKLQASEERYRRLADSITDVFFAFDKDLKYTYWNKASEKLTGIDEKNAIGKSLYEIFPDTPQTRKLEQAYKDVLKNRKAQTLINDFTLEDRDFVFEINIYPSESGISVFVKDITKLKQSEKIIRETEARLRAVLNSAPITIYATDEKGVFTLHEGKAITEVGMKPGENVGVSAFDLYRSLSFYEYTGIETKGEDVLNRVLRGETVSGITELRGAYFDNQIAPIRDENQKITGIVGVATDITIRKRMEDVLEENAAMLRSIFCTVTVGIGFVKNRTFEWTNETYEKITGFSESELKGKSTRMVYPDDEEFKRAGRMYEIMKEHGVGSIEVKHKHKNGNIIDVLISIAPIIPGDINSGITFTLLDITERKNAEKKIREKSEDLSLLANINALVNRGADIDSITGELSRELKRIFDCDGAAIMLMDKKGESLVIRNIPFIKAKITGFERLIGQKLTGLKIKVSTDFIHHQILESKKIMLINSPDEICQLVMKYAENPLLQKYIPDILKLLGVNSVTIIPLVSNNDPIGIIVISSRKVFKQDIIERIENLSENLANIIARKQTESKLKASETRFRAFMENLPVMIYMKDKDGKFIYGNKPILKLAGRTSETYTGSFIADFLPGDLARWMKQMDRKVLMTMKSIDLGEWRCIKDNREQWLKEFKFPILLPDGETLIGGWMMDVTARKVIESALKESESRYKDLVEKAGIAIMTDDTKGNIIYFNREFARLFGYTIAEMKKQSLETLIHTGDLKQKISYHKKRMKGKKVQNSDELRGIQKNGNEIWIESIITVLTEKNKAIGTRNYMWDITNRKKIMEALEISETRFRELFSSISSGVAIYTYDPVRKDYLFKDINRAGMAISRINHKGDILNKYLLECFPGAKELGLWGTLNKVRRTGISQKVPNIFYKDERLSHYIENFVCKLPGGEMVVLYDDISEKVLAEKNILRQFNEIKKLSYHLESVREEERKMIARDLHDDLGQILTAVKMDISWIRNKIPVEKTGIKKRSESAIQIVDQAIQNVRRISSELRPVILDDLGLFETLIAHIRDYENRFKIIVKYKFPVPEPELNPDQQITIFRIIQEALTNIARHSKASAVDLDLREKDDNLKILIRDNGTGIPDQKLYSDDSFGLISMRERVLQWDGKITISGKENKGTTINVSIPLK
jgi:PAS domain S-box-containing protein